MCTVLVGCHGSPHPGRPGLTILALGCATHAARATAPPRAQGKAAVRPCGPVEAAELARSRDTLSRHGGYRRPPLPLPPPPPRSVPYPYPIAEALTRRRQLLLPRALDRADGEAARARRRRGAGGVLAAAATRDLHALRAASARGAATTTMRRDHPRLPACWPVRVFSSIQSARHRLHPRPDPRPHPHPHHSTPTPLHSRTHTRARARALPGAAREIRGARRPLRRAHAPAERAERGGRERAAPLYLPLISPKSPHISQVDESALLKAARQTAETAPLLEWLRLLASACMQVR